MLAPTPTPAMIAGTGAQPCLTLSTATIAAQTPDTAPTDRSISPSSRTSTTPTEISATAVICSDRLTMLVELRKRLSCDWKITQTIASRTSTRSDPRSPVRIRLRKSRPEVGSDSFCAAAVVSGSAGGGVGAAVVLTGSPFLPSSGRCWP